MTRWNIVVNEQTDHELRHFLASIGENRRGALSQFIEEAVRIRLQSIAEESGSSDFDSCQEEDLQDYFVVEEYLSALEKEGM
jgi:hypothetical protein